MDKAVATTTEDPSPKLASLLTVSAAQNHIAALTAARDAWHARVRTKAEATAADVTFMESSYDEAMAALQSQKARLSERAAQHVIEWNKVNDNMLEMHAKRIAAAGERASELGAVAATTPTVNPAESQAVAELRAEMVRLNQRLEQQTAAHTLQLTAVHREAEVKVMSWQKYCEGLKVSTAEMSPAEREQRATHSAAVRLDQAPPCLADGAQKGGSASASADILQGALGVLA